MSFKRLDRTKAKAVFNQRYIEHTTIDQALDHLERCVTEDPRIARLWQIVEYQEARQGADGMPVLITAAAIRFALSEEADNG